MKRFLIDTNVCLDAGLLRLGKESAGKIFYASEAGLFDGYVAVHTMDNIFYIVKQQVDSEAAYRLLHALAKTVKIGPINQQIFNDALHAGWPDFEDAMQYYCARHLECDGIITRNQKDYGRSELPVISPEEFLTNVLKRNS